MDEPNKPAGQPPQTAPSARGRGNGRMAVLFAGVAVGMVGLAFAAVPLYQMICAVTGLEGTPRTDASATLATPSAEQAAVVMTVRFDANVTAGMPWRFVPADSRMTLHVGEPVLAMYRATNTGTEPVVGTATFNVTPLKAAQYFNKIECFCFTEQRLEPGQTADMPVQFVIDPALLEDPLVREVRTMTLSYTFFRKKPEDQS